MEFIETSDPDLSDPLWALAAKMSSKSLMKFKLGAIIVKRGKILGWGNNQKKSHPIYGSKDCYKTMHAEGASLYTCKKLGNDPTGATMIVYRRGGRLSKPCLECQKLIAKHGITKVIYTNYETGLIEQTKRIRNTK